GLPREHGGPDRAVAREAHVVELDLVEAGARRSLGDPDDVLPDLLAVGVRPAEARVVDPDGTVAVLDREIRPGGGQHRVLVDHDPPDQVDAGRMRLAGRGSGRVVRLRGTDLARERPR